MILTINGLCVNPVLGSVRLEKSRKEAAATLTAVIWTAAADTYFLHLSLKVGDTVRLTDDDGTERFLGSVHEISRTPEKATLTSFDRGVYLARNEIHGVFAGTGAEICRQAMSKLDIPIGELDAKSEYQVIPALSGINVFALLRQAAGEDREITLENDKLIVRKKRNVTYLLRSEHIRESSASADIRKMVNRCIVTDYKGEIVAAAENNGDISAYGALQSVFCKQGDSPSGQAQKALRGRSMAAEAVLHGNAGYQCGAYVRGQQPQWGLEGLYQIAAVAHCWENGDFTTELTLEGTE